MDGDYTYTVAQWGITQASGHWFVDEKLQGEAHVSRYGPLASEDIAEQLIRERRRLVSETIERQVGRAAD